MSIKFIQPTTGIVCGEGRGRDSERSRCFGKDGHIAEDNATRVCSIDLNPIDRVVLESDGAGCEGHGVVVETKASATEAGCRTANRSTLLKSNDERFMKQLMKRTEVTGTVLVLRREKRRHIQN